jgi:tetratricopeptide (TPR) repeat protein
VRFGRRCWWAIPVLLLLALGTSARAAGEDDELRARTFFAAAKYQEALDIYARLYAETLHPTYLRNIGRCYQKMGDADRAISSFEEYLRKAKDLSAEQRAEIEGYVADMEKMKRSRATAAAPPPAGTGPPPAPSSPDMSSPALLDSSTVVTKTASDSEADPFYTRWWFWTAVAAVAVAGIASAVLLSAGDSPSPGNLGALDLTDKRP